MSLPISVYFPAGNHFGIGLQASPARASGDQLAGLGSVGDLRTTLSYDRRIGEGSVVVNTGLNIPNGKEELSREEFETVQLLTRNFYDFRVPSFGRGFDMSLGATWAYPVSDRFSIGVGGSFLHQGAYRPLASREEAYDPGNEFVLTGGLDYQPGQTRYVSGDLTYTIYGADVWAARRFEAGNKAVITLQYLQYVGFDELRVIGRYRQRGKTKLPVGNELTTVEERTLPNQGTLMGVYRRRLSSDATVGVRLTGHYYGHTAVYSSKYVLDFGVESEMSMADGFTLLARVGYTTGSIRGFTVGIGGTVKL